MSVAIALLPAVTPGAAAEHFAVLKPDKYMHHVERFNRMEDENRTNFVANAQSWNWLCANIPLFECPDPEVEEIYYYRWWSFRKHLVQTTHGFVITEFLVPVRHAGAHNTISCAVGHHLAEGRWLRDQRYLDDYTRFWLQGNGGKPQPHFHRFSSWFAAAVYDRYLVNLDRPFLVGWLSDLAADYRIWEQERRLANGLFWQYDVQDGTEESISGSRMEKNIRPTINSYMYGNARAIAAIARLAGNTDWAGEFEHKAAELKRLVQETLWNPAARFFEVRRGDGRFAKAQTLNALAIVLRDYSPTVIGPKDYFGAFLTYVRSQQFEGKSYIGEYLDETTGQWLKGRQERSRYDNHSTCADLLITGVIGLRPRADETVEIFPLLPAQTWDWFCLDGVKYHGQTLTIVWDKDGKRYGQEPGLRVLAGGQVLAQTDELHKLTGRLP